MIHTHRSLTNKVKSSGKWYRLMTDLWADKIRVTVGYRLMISKTHRQNLTAGLEKLNRVDINVFRPTQLKWYYPSWLCNYVCLRLHPFVQASADKCKIIYCKQMAVPRSSNFCTYKQVYRIHSLAQFHSNSQRFLTFIFKVKDSNRVHWQVHTRLSRKRWQIEQTLQLPTRRKSHLAVRLAYIYIWL